MKRTYKEFPTDIKKRSWGIYKDKIIIDGYKCFDLKELKKISQNIRLSIPAEILTAIDKVK